MQEFKKLSELSQGYKKALKPISQRIREIESNLKGIPERKIPVSEKDRLRALREMKRELIDLERLTKNYYKPGWWRSAKYTQNTR